MAEKLTLQQKEAIVNRGGNLLVSAAAGSGKTKVLVDRLLKYLTDEGSKTNLDDFLIITYTKAAASELRSKIGAKLSERIAQEPFNKHLQRQMQRLYLAKISTVHSFCADLLKEYAYRLDIPGDFRVAEENECLELQMTALENVLDKAYSEIHQDPLFQNLVDTQGLGRDDRMIPQLVLRVYNSSRCHLNPERWLQMCEEQMSVSKLEDAAQTRWGSYLIEDLKDTLGKAMDALRRCADSAACADEMAKPTALLLDTIQQYQRLYNSQSWNEIVSNSDIDYGRLTFSKKCTDTDLISQIKTVRENCKDLVGKKLKSFSDSSSQVLTDLESCSCATKGLTQLTRSFAKEYERLKRSRRILDFGDLEHKTLDLLLGRQRSGVTAIAQDVSKRFCEIMVDEYQDSNQVQDAIFSVLTKQKNNCFMVGDVKQSIYQFRLADPGIFLEKYHDYVSADNALDGQGRKVLLSHNFRSSAAVISAVNDVFRSCMSPSVGGLYYGSEEELREGIPHIEVDEPEVSFYAIPVEADTYLEESHVTAQKIRELLNGKHMVRDGDKLRPIIPDDIVILLRSPKSVGSDFCRALEAYGIPCSMGSSSDLLQEEEISVVRSLLQVISNPLQDIPLIAVLMSRVFGFTADEIAAIRAGRRGGAFYSALKASKDMKSIAFLEKLQLLRDECKMLNLRQLMDRIFEVTLLDSIYKAMPNGVERLSNLQQFLQVCSDFESTVHGDLYRFLEYLEVLAEKGVTSTSEEKQSGCVTVMSIHKSKGLEFPVVFLCGLSRGFNKENLRASVLCDKELGIGLSCIDVKNRIRYPSVARRAISLKMQKDALSEEMRVLYVAMTRAKDRLVMTYAVKNPASIITEAAQLMDMCPKEMLTESVDCPGDWVLQTALQRIESGALFSLGGRPRELSVSDRLWDVQVVVPELCDTQINQCTKNDLAVSNDVYDRLSKSLKFRYAHIAASQMPSKLTATQLKGRYKDQEAAQDASEKPTNHHSFRTPSFAGKAKNSLEYGNALHLFMQYLDYSHCFDVEAVKGEILRQTQDGIISEEQGKMIDPAVVADFFASNLGQRVIKAKNVVREFKFSILDKGERYDSHLRDEKILLQGVVDCAIIEEDGITVIDFKTDRVTENNIQEVAEGYRMQVEAYADALARIYMSQIKEVYLYFFKLGRAVLM